MQSQFVLEVCQYTISQDIWPGKISRNVVVHMEGRYRNKIVRSSEYKLNNGTQLAIPWSDKLDEVVIIYRYIDERLKVELGTSTYLIPTEIGFQDNGENNRTILDILPNGGEMRVGRVLCNIRVQKLYHDENEKEALPRKPRNTESFAETIPGFKFRRLAKAINWNKMKLINVDR
jgi:hypothetical protein